MPVVESAENTFSTFNRSEILNVFVVKESVKRFFAQVSPFPSTRKEVFSFEIS